VPVGVLLVVGVGVYFGWPYLMKVFTKPEAEGQTVPTFPLGSDPFRGKSSAEIRDELLAQIRAGLKPALSAMMRLDPTDFQAVQDAQRAAAAPRKPWESPPPFLFPKEAQVTPKLSAAITARLFELGAAATGQPAVAAGKTYPLEELVAAVQPAVPMVRVRWQVTATVVVSGGKPQTTVLTYESAGTGFVIDAAGHVVTNWHVAAEVPRPDEVIANVAARQKVKPSDVKLVGDLAVRPPEITLVFQGRHRVFAKSLPAVGPAEGGRPFTLPAKLVGSDEAADLAVLKVDGCTFPFLRFADPAGLKVGQAVTSVGYPHTDAIPGDPTANDGTVSGLNRTPTNGGQADSVQHSAHINPGNSGGPLLNRAGEVVGVNTYALPDESVKGVYFSRGPRTAVPFVEQLVRLGRVVRPDPGFAVAQLDFRNDRISRQANLAYSTAVVVSNLRGKSAADLFDLILQVDGRPVTTLGEWNDVLGLLEKGRPAAVRLTVKRPPATLKAEGLAGKVPHDTVLRAAWEANERDVTVPLTWPK
jgi:S1-C subfamily serine protease